jgi:hypothetical protein
MTDQTATVEDERQLLEACRAVHARPANATDAADAAGAEVSCVCGAAGPPSPACRALARLRAEVSRLRRLRVAMTNYRMALWDVPAERIEVYLREHGWYPVDRDEATSRWECQDGGPEWVATVGYRDGYLRPVDHLTNTLETLERYEQRPRYEILAEILPDSTGDES